MISERKYQEAVKRYESARKRIKNVKAEAEGAVMQVVQTLEVSGGAFTVGMVDGYFNGVEFLGIPLGLVVGGGAHVLGACDVAPEHLHNIGDGSLGAYFTSLGLGLGEDMRRKNAAPPAAAASGYSLPGSVSGAGLTDLELAAIAQHA